MEAAKQEELGRPPSDAELAASFRYREMAIEYASLRERRDEHRSRVASKQDALHQWQELLLQLGFDVRARLTELELLKSRWHMEFSGKHGGRSATLHEQLNSRKYVLLHEAIQKEKGAVTKLQRALDRVTSFGRCNALIRQLERTAEFHASTDALMRRLAKKSAKEGVMRVHRLLDAFVAHDSAGLGALGVADFLRMARHELGDEALGFEQGDGRDEGADGGDADALEQEKSLRMHERADVDRDGYIDFNECVNFMEPYLANNRVTTAANSFKQRKSDSPQMQGITPTTDLLGRAAVHLAESFKPPKKKKSGKVAGRAPARSDEDAPPVLPREGTHTTSVAVKNASGGGLNAGGGAALADEAYHAMHQQAPPAAEARSGGTKGSVLIITPQEQQQEAATAAAASASALGSDGNPGTRALSLGLEPGAERKRAEAEERLRLKLEKEERAKRREAARKAARELNQSYLATLRSAVERTTAAGYEDHTKALSPRTLKQLCRQMIRFDSSGTGTLSLDDFFGLCAKLAESAGLEEPLNQMQLVGLFTQADVTGAHRICASQWAWARGQLATIITDQVRALERKTLQEEVAREEARKAEEAAAVAERERKEALKRSFSQVMVAEAPGGRQSPALLMQQQNDAPLALMPPSGLD